MLTMPSYCKVSNLIKLYWVLIWRWLLKRVPILRLIPPIGWVQRVLTLRYECSPRIYWLRVQLYTMYFFSVPAWWPSFLRGSKKRAYLGGAISQKDTHLCTGWGVALWNLLLSIKSIQLWLSSLNGIRPYPKKAYTKDTKWMSSLREEWLFSNHQSKKAYTKATK